MRFFILLVLYDLFQSSISVAILQRHQRSTYTKLSDDLENWMTNLPGTIRDCIPINALAIPGTHDSFTTKMNYTSGAPPEMYNYPVVYVLELLGPVVRQVMVNWLRTQTYTATQQLKAGIRYFDLRIATKEGSHDFYFVHGLYTETVEPIFVDIVRFLKKHPKELIILDCQEFYGLTNKDHHKFISLLDKYFGTRAALYVSDMSTLSLSYLTEIEGHQVMIVYRDDKYAIQVPWLWPEASFPNSWLSTTSQPQLFKNLDKDIKYRNSTTALISICILTADVPFMITHFLHDLKTDSQLPLQKPMLSWISNQNPGLTGLNIMITNFVELDNNAFARAVIDLNSLLLQEECNIL